MGIVLCTFFTYQVGLCTMILCQSIVNERSGYTLCPACAYIVINPTQAGHRLQREWQMEPCAFLQLTTSNKQAMGVIPSQTSSAPAVFLVAMLPSGAFL